MPDIAEKHIVATAWLAANLGSPGLVVLDGSWHLPQEKRDPKAEFAAAHIPGARFFDIDATSDHSSSLPHMLSSPEHFAARMKALLASNNGPAKAKATTSNGTGLRMTRQVAEKRAVGNSKAAKFDGVAFLRALK